MSTISNNQKSPGNNLKNMANERGQLYLRLIDRYIGIPLCILFGFFKFRKCKTIPPPSVVGLIIFGAIGDALLASCVLEGLRRIYPKAKIILFVSTSNSGVSKLLRNFDEVCIVPVKKPLEAINKIRRYKLDLLVDSSQWPRISSIVSFFASAKFTIGFKSPGQFRHYPYDCVVCHSNKRHEFENFKELAHHFGAPNDLDVSINDSKEFNSISHFIKKQYIVFHPWASGYKSHMREWPLSEWVNLAAKLAKLDFDIVVTGSVEDELHAINLCENICKVCNVINLSGKLTLEELTGCLSNANLVVSVNTGVMHLASLLGCHVVSLNGPTNSLRWGGIGPNTYNLNVDKDQGGAYLNLGFEYPNNAPEIMSKISHSQVLEIIHKACM